MKVKILKKEEPNSNLCTSLSLPLSEDQRQRKRTLMETFSMLILFLSFLTLLFQPSYSKTIVVDGVEEWRNPSVHVGDSIIFKHKHQYNLYIFQNRRAFNLCNFTQATLLSKSNSTSFMWNPSRPGFFYFSFYNGSLKTCEGEKLAIKVISTPPENWAMSPESPPLAAPSPTSGGVVPSSPAYPWPFRSHQASSPNLAPSASPPATTPSLLPDKGGGIPFINSNPAVPLPTGEADSVTIRPLPTSDHGKKVVGLLAVRIPLCFMVLLMFC
ncbi:hypothetical protein HHK36_009317 [Tetracentron sinense]|uniref:Uncharacterized protein n=1 Tax=Tetracentron sinense TaxID=13715 RepID=A0A835DKX2_TETSI|nr:hypothetical protein HHK36_009317 [Tetracentron sinense]